MGKKNAKRLLVLTFTIFFGITTYFCFPFFINFNDDKKTGIENILSELIFYKVNIKGNIEYKLNPFPTLQISEIYLNKENENSIIDNINVEVSPYCNNIWSYNFKDWLLFNYIFIFICFILFFRREKVVFNVSTIFSFCCSFYVFASRSS